MSRSNPSVIVGRTYPSRAATSASVASTSSSAIDARDALDARDLPAHRGAQRLEQLALARLDALGGREHALLVFLERRRHVPLARRSASAGADSPPERDAGSRCVISM